MKKLIISISLLAAISCGRVGNAVNPISNNKCEKAAAEYEKIVTEWVNDPNNKSKCEALKKSLNDIIKDCSVYTTAQRKIYEDQVKLLTCD